MSENLPSNLSEVIRIIEERLGRFGRPFTTAIVVSAGLGIISWGGHAFFTKLVLPVAGFFGLPFNKENAASFATLALAMAIFGVSVVFIAYAFDLAGKFLRRWPPWRRN